MNRLFLSLLHKGQYGDKKNANPRLSGRSIVQSLAVTAALSIGVSVHAVTPLNDIELNNNFLQNDILLPESALNRQENLDRQVDLALVAVSPEQQEERLNSQNQGQLINQVLVLSLPTSATSSIAPSLDKKEREVNFFANYPTLGIALLTEIAAGEFGSEPYSYRWEGNYDQIVDLEQVGNFYINHSTGDYEIKNIRGTVDIIIASRHENNYGRTFRREVHIF